MIYAVLAGFTHYLPEVSFTDGIGGAITNLNGYIAGLSFVVPTITLVAIVGLFLAINGALLGISIVNWFIRKIPTVN